MKSTFYIAAFWLLSVQSVHSKGIHKKSDPSVTFYGIRTNLALHTAPDRINSANLNSGKFNFMTGVVNQVKLPVLNFRHKAPGHKEFAILYWDLKISFQVCKNLMLVLKYN